jgi:hypothetical protein
VIPAKANDKKNNIENNTPTIPKCEKTKGRFINTRPGPLDAFAPNSKTKA